MRKQALFGAVFVLLSIFMTAASHAAPYAAMVMDARTGEVLHSRNANTRLHPASLTKMMTLYVVFAAVERGELSMDAKVKISKNAASEPPSKLGLRAGSHIKLRHLVRAAAVKSANDAATALGEAVSGSEAAFARRMNRTAKKLGMTRTTFKNAHGLTQKGHMSTARDMTILGRRLMYDFPQYYNLFSRRTADAGIKDVANTNRRLLSSYRGADGIKTGYTRASGFNLVASAEHGNKRIIATVFGGKTSADRTRKIAALLDKGFGRAPNRYAASQPKPGNKTRLKVADINKKLPGKAKLSKGKTIKAPRAVAVSLIPKRRPDLRLVVAAVNQKQQSVEEAIIAANLKTLETKVAPSPEPETTQVAALAAPEPQVDEAQVIQVVSVVNAIAMDLEPNIMPDEPVIVERVANQGGNWAVQLGAFTSRYQAEKTLLRTALADIGSLEGALRKIDLAYVKGRQVYRARFVGINQSSANKTCARLQARREDCSAVNLGG